MRKEISPMPLIKSSSKAKIGMAVGKAVGKPLFYAVGKGAPANQHVCNQAGNSLARKESIGGAPNTFFVGLNTQMAQ